MATIRLVPSSYTLSNTYLSISNATYIYANTDSTTYATINHTRSATTAYYVYVKGFKFSDIPSNAIINSAIVKVKALVTKASTTQKPALYNNQTIISGAPTFSASIGSSTTISTVDITSQFATYKGYGNNFGIRLSLNRSSKSVASTMQIYGAEILIDYSLPVYHDVSTHLNGDGTVDPSGTKSLLEGSSQTITIVPTDGGAMVTATDNGNNITLTQHASESSISAVIQNYAIVTGSFNSGESYFSGAVGKGYDTSSQTASNGYAKSGSTVTIKYTFDLSGVPQNATNIKIRCRIKGHAESTSNSSEHCDCQLYANDTAKGTMKSFKNQGSTSPNVMELDDTGSWNRDELDNLQLRVIVGYYGGAIDGATIDVSYDGSNGCYYTYQLNNIIADHDIVITIGKQDVTTLYTKYNGAWKEVVLYKKVGGSWVTITDLTTLDETKTWVKGN